MASNSSTPNQGGRPSKMSTLRDELRRRASRPVDAAGLVVLRIAYGVVLVCEVARYLGYGWTRADFIEPGYRFTYQYFDWVKPWFGNGLYAVFLVVAVAGVLIALGSWYRTSLVVATLGLAYLFLLDYANYLNHWYLITLFGGLLLLVPADRSCSLSVRRHPERRLDRVPAWTVWIPRLQLLIVYLFAGIAKFNPDWLAGQPLHLWLSERAETSLLGPLLEQLWVAQLGGWIGIGIDVLAVPLILWRPTRWAAFFAVTAFHLGNHYMFTVGVFPLFMIPATTILLPTDWPRRLWQRWKPARSDFSSSASPVRLPPRWGVVLLAAYLAIQLALPLRHLAYPGNVDWTDEGFDFAWRLKLVHKDGRSRFLVRVPATGGEVVVDPRDELTERQYWFLSGSPKMILQYAHHLRDRYSEIEGSPVQVYVLAEVSMNQRARQLIVDPGVDLARVPRSLAHRWWVLPLQSPVWSP